MSFSTRPIADDPMPKGGGTRRILESRLTNPRYRSNSIPTRSRWRVAYYAIAVPTAKGNRLTQTGKFPGDLDNISIGRKPQASP